MPDSAGKSSALDWLFSQGFRQYQIDFLTDFSPRRMVLKARRVGLSEAAAFDVVMTTSGLWERLGAPVKTHNYSVISKRDTEAQQFIRYCKRWIEALSEDPELAPYLELDVDSKTALTFAKSGYRIQSDTQSEMAGRGQEGHLLKDEAAWYPYAREIVAGADKIPLSNPELRLTEFSTPNGTSGMGEVFWRKWTDRQQFGDYSRHHIDIYRAIEDGFPLTVDAARANCFTEDEFLQEFCCAFVAGESEYFTRQMLEAQQAQTPAGAPDEVVVGVDVASVNDLTAVAVLKRWGRALWLTDCYIISGVPYGTSTTQRGQEDIVAELLRGIAPDRTVIDASGDGAELYGRLLSKNVGELVPHSFHRGGRQWKESWVPRIRQEIEKGIAHFVDFKPEVYVASAGEFRAHHYPQVLYDFLKVERKMLQTGVTFDTPRTSDGHGDTFWAYAMARSRVTGQSAGTAKGQFKKLLDAATGSATPSYTGYL